MAKAQTQVRGTSASGISKTFGAINEIAIDLDNHTLYIFDGVKLGGYAIGGVGGGGSGAITVSTKAAVLASTPSSGKSYWVTDVGNSGALTIYDGTTWRVILASGNLSDFT